MDEFKGVAPELKRELGQKLNRLKSAAVSRIEELKSTIGAREDAGSARIDDMTRPGSDGHIGSRHPISLVKTASSRYSRDWVIRWPTDPRSRTTGMSFRL